MSPAARVWEMQVIVTIRLGNYSNRMSGIDLRPWVTVVESCVASQEAVDHAISIQAPFLHGIVKDAGTPFFVVSRDQFPHELCAELRSIGRSCSAVSDILDLV
jgi:hypothetical protein